MLGGVYVLVARVEYADHEAERYVVPLAMVTDTRHVAPHAVVATLRLPKAMRPLVDAMEERASARALLAAVVARTRAAASAAASRRRRSSSSRCREGEPANISAQHAAAAVRYGDRYLLKMFRRLEEGVSPELELGRFLNGRAPGLTPAVVGAITTAATAPSGHARRAGGLRPQRGDRLVARAGGAAAFLRARADPPPGGRRAGRGAAPPERAGRGRAAGSRARRRRGYLDLAALLGQRTAEMHLALASNVDDARLHAGALLDPRPPVELPVGAQPGRQDARACCATAAALPTPPSTTRGA